MKFIPTTLAQRKKYYQFQFDQKKVFDWFKKNKISPPQLCALDMGSETKIILDKKKMGKLINFIPRHLQQKLIETLPEDVYYDRNRYTDPKVALKKLAFKESFSDLNFLGQELAFDIDANNFDCSCIDVCEKCIAKSQRNSLKVGKKLEEHFSRIGYVYSGRGMHVHVFDKRAFSLSIKERQDINTTMRSFGIDPWVSRGRIRLMRLPFSLNGLVSRIVVPLSADEVETFNPLTDKRTIPTYSSSASSFLS